MLTRSKVNYFALFFLIIYFCTKMLWDSVSFNLTEYFSLALIMYGFIFWINRPHKKTTILFAWYISFSIYIIFNGLILTDMSHLIRGIYEYIFYALIFFSCIGLLKDMEIRDLIKLFKVLSLVSFLLSILTVIEYIRGVAFISTTGNTAYGTFISGYGYTFRAKVFTRSYLSHGMIMGIMSLINLCMYKIEKNKKWIIIYFMCILSVLLTSSRGPLVATTIATCYFLFNHNAITKTKKNTFIYIFLIITVFLFGIYTIFFSNTSFQNETVNYFITRIRNIFNWSGDAGNLGRIKRWLTYWEYFWSHNILFGSGTSLTGSSGLDTLGLGTTESGIIKRFIELGIIGTLLYYKFVFKTIRVSAKELKKDKRPLIVYLKKLAFAVVISVLIDDFVLQITEEIMVTFYFWFFMALLICTALYYSQKTV